MLVWFWLVLIGAGIYYSVHYGYPAVSEAVSRWSTGDCERRWRRSDLNTGVESWSWVLLVYVDGRWIPEANVQLRPTK